MWKDPLDVLVRFTPFKNRLSPEIQARLTMELVDLGSTMRPAKVDQKWGLRGALGGDLGTILVPGWPKAQKWDQTTANKYYFLGTKIGIRTSFSWFAFYFLGLAIFPICVGFGGPKPRFRRSFWLNFETSEPLGKQLKVL